MSSRWEALKPSSSSHDEKTRKNNNGAGRGKQQQQQQQRSGRRDFRKIHRNGDTTTKPSDGGGVRRGGSRTNDPPTFITQRKDSSSNWRNQQFHNDNHRCSKNVQETTIATKESNAGDGPKSAAWDRLTKCLLDMKQKKNTNNEPNNNSEEEIRSILKQLSEILSEEPTQGKSTFNSMSIARNDAMDIDSTQRGNALAAVLQLLSSCTKEEDSNTLMAVLEWSCHLLLLSSRIRIQMSTIQAQRCVHNLLHVKSLALSNMDEEGSQKNNNYNNQSNDNKLQREYYKCFMNFIIAFAGLLPAEETAHQVIAGVTLPFLEEFMNSDNSIDDINDKNNDAQQQEQQTVVLFLQALHSQLKVKNLASALLAPLVNDVAADGREQYLINPLRSRIFHVLQRGLQKTTSSTTALVTTTLAEHILQCLTTALQMATIVDKSAQQSLPQRQNSSSYDRQQFMDLDASVVEKLLKDTLYGNNPLLDVHTNNDTIYRIRILELLLAFLKMRPEAGLSLGKILLFREQNQRHSPAASSATSRDVDGAAGTNKCPNCGIINSTQSPYSLFLNHLHCVANNNNNTEESVLIMECLVVIIHSIPWKLWMGRTQTQTMQVHKHRGAASSNFSQRVTDALLGIVCVTKCLLVSRLFHPTSNTFQNRQQQQSSSDSLIRLVRAVLMEVPYSNGSDLKFEQQGLEKAARTLFETLADTSFLLNERQSVPFREAMSEIFAEAMGGSETPEGTRTVMVGPAKDWFLLPSSQVFVDHLIGHIGDAAKDGGKPIEGIHSSKMAITLFRSILRARPETLLGNETDWIKFQNVVEQLCEKENKMMQLSGLQLLADLLHGRYLNNSRIGKQKETTCFALSILPRMVRSNSGPTRIVCFEAYGALLGSDWMMDSQDTSDKLKCHVDLILSHCITGITGTKRVSGYTHAVGGELVANVRSTACKAIGDICSNCFLSADQESHGWRQGALAHISHDTCQTLLEAMADTNASVRNMALFAIGNLAQVMGCASGKLVLDAVTLRDACGSVFGCIDDKNDKVSGNAVRSLGHFVVLLCRVDYAVALNEIEWGVMSFCERVISALCGKVDRILLTVPGQVERSFSWKQRSATKKQGRVACNSMALIFSRLSSMRLLESETLEVCLTAVDSLVNCVSCLGTPLDDKVIIAAILALKALDSSLLSRISGKSGTVGRAIVSCILYLAPKWEAKPTQRPNDKLFPQVESLLVHLLDSAHIQDSALVVAYDEIAESLMEPLYEWMILKNCAHRAFDNFALALQKPDLNIPISVEQRFSNRAMYLLRSAQSPQKHLDLTSSFNDAIKGNEDEL